MLRFLVPFCLLSFTSSAQVGIQWAVNVDLELSKAGDSSSYFTNEINSETTGWSFDIARVQGQLDFIFNKNLSFHSHFIVQRKRGWRNGLFQDLDNYTLKVAQLALDWKNDERNVQVLLGRIQNPFGYWYKRQSFKDRSILSAPLMYSYFINVSPKKGFVPSLGEENAVLVNGVREFGFSNLYNRGYRNGFAFLLGKETDLQFTLSAYNGNAGSKDSSLNPFLWNVVTKLSYPINYSWKVGLSYLHGTFLKDDTVDTNDFRQSIYSINLVYSQQYWSVESELFLSNYRTPVYDLESDTFVRSSENTQIISLNNLSYYSTIRYEPPWLSGAFFAYRFDALLFGEDPTSLQNRDWDDDVIRHSFGIGYKVLSDLSIRMSFSTQQVDDGIDMDQQQTFRTVLSYGF